MSSLRGRHQSPEKTSPTQNGSSRSHSIQKRQWPKVANHLCCTLLTVDSVDACLHQNMLLFYLLNCFWSLAAWLLFNFLLFRMSSTVNNAFKTLKKVSVWNKSRLLEVLLFFTAFYSWLRQTTIIINLLVYLVQTEK